MTVPIDTIINKMEATLRKLKVEAASGNDEQMREQAIVLRSYAELLSENSGEKKSRANDATPTYANSEKGQEAIVETDAESDSLFDF